MALTRPLLAVVVLLLAALAPSAAAAPASTTSQIVVYKDNVPNPPAQTRARERSVGFHSSHRYRTAVRGFSADLTPAQITRLRNDPSVARVVADRPVAVDSLPLVPGGLVPAGVRRVGSIQSGTIRGPAGIAVAVIDTGIDLGNPDLNVAAGTNCTDDTPPQDANGHGTHVAGTIGARNDGTDAVGVAPGTLIYAVKVLGTSGQGSTSDVICGIDWVAQHAQSLGIEVANMSLGGLGPVGTCESDPEHEAICNAVAAGVTVVAAAGNDSDELSGSSSGHVPGAFPEVLTASAFIDTDGIPGGTGTTCNSASDDSALALSNYGVTAAEQAHMIAAPGGCVVSSKIGGGTATMSGTSMASPHVAAAAALCIADDSGPGPCDGLAPSEVIQTLRQTAADAATLDNGFADDPLHAGGQYYGYLVRASEAPAATTGDAAVGGETVADLDGTIDGNGAATQWWFELTAAGVTTQTDAKTSEGDADPVPVQAAVTGLDPGTTYDYRLVVSVDGWTVKGAVKSFSTTGTAPPPAPDTRLDAAPSPVTSAGDAEFRFSTAPGSPAPAASFECKLDGGAWTACASPDLLSGLPDGTHTFAVRGVNSAGKTDLTPASSTWTIDRVPPETQISGAPSKRTNNTSATFGITASEPATFKCRLDGEAWATCGATVKRTDMPFGAHRFEAQATDAAGLSDATPAVYEWTVLGPQTDSTPSPEAAPTDTPAEPSAPFVSPPPVQLIPRRAVLAIRSGRLDRDRAHVKLAVVCRGPGPCTGILGLRLNRHTVKTSVLNLRAGARKRLSIAIPRGFRAALLTRRTWTASATVTRATSPTVLERFRLRLLT